MSGPGIHVWRHRALVCLLSVFVLSVFASGCGDDGGDDGGAGPDPTTTELTAVSPERVIVGDVVTITGVNLGDGGAGASVLIGGAEADVVSWDDTEVVVEVPMLFPGEQPVSVQLGDDAYGGLSVTVSLPRRAYVASGERDASDHDLIQVLAIGADGALSLMSEAAVSVGIAGAGSFGGAPGNLAIDEARRLLFFSGTDGIAIFAIDAREGTLTHIEGSPFDLGSGSMYGLAVSPDGGDLYVSYADSNELAHLRVAEDGTIDPEEVVAYPVGGSSDAVYVTADGRFVYTTSGYGVSGFRRTAATGALTAIEGSPWDLVEETYGCGLNPSGSRLYCGNYSAYEIAALDIDATSGALTTTAGSPWEVDNEGPMGVAFHPDGTRVWVTMWRDGAVSSFDVDAQGGLEHAETLETVDEPAAIVVSDDGTVLVLVGQASRTVQSFTISATGFESAGAALVFGSSAYPTALRLAGFR